MGYIDIITEGSFPYRHRTFTAFNKGHAHAVAEAIKFLSEEVLAEAIERDHRLHGKGTYPNEGFDRP